MDRRMILGTVSILAGGLIATGLWATSRDVAQAPHLAASSKDSEHTQRILRRLDSVERTLREREAPASAVRLDGSASVKLPPPDPDEASDSSSASSESREQVLAREREAAIQFYDDLDLRFEEESRDPRWSVDAETALRSATGKADSIGITTESMECRSGSCRTVLSHETRRPARDFIREFANATALQLSHSFHYDDGRTIIYSFREQHAEAH
jgi:hypothetical protein